MSNPTQMRRRVNTTGVRPFDEGCADVDTRPPSSARRYQAPPQTTSAPLSGDVPPRARAASRPAPRTAPVKYDAVEINTQDDPAYRQRQQPGARRSNTTDVYNPNETHYPEFDRSRQKARSYVYASQEEEEQSQYTRYNRRQRRSLTKQEAIGLLCRCLIVLVLGLLLLYYLGSVASEAFTTHMSDPAAYGPAHGNVVHMTDGTQDYYVEGFNDNGQIAMIIDPEGHLDKAKVYIGVETSASAEVELEVKDVNHDGHPDLVEHILFDPSYLFVPRPHKDVIYLNDGKGQFKLEGGE